jgi:hypothetical protein
VRRGRALLGVYLSVPLEPPDQQHWQAAAGYVELGMFLEADAELDKIDPFNRAAPEVLAIRLAIYHGLKKWALMQEIAKRLADWQRQERAFGLLRKVYAKRAAIRGQQQQQQAPPSHYWTGGFEDLEDGDY